MEVRVHDTTCPGCGASLDIGKIKCPFCKEIRIVTTFNSVASMPMPLLNQRTAGYQEALQAEPDNKALNASIAFCYLKLKLYDKALVAFEKAIEDNFDHSDIYFRAAICLLKGKKAFSAQRSDIERIEKYINAALAIEPQKGIYHYFLAYIKYDYFERKFLNTTPTYKVALAAAKASGLSPVDIEQLFVDLGVLRPSVM
ncbi:hypothetical protein FACS1894139_08870 [Planctomycetales bacterium]|nr:hypothetical protein FACS1894107_14820 [Planctomycetales bacterium]GHS98182.1 hypothetical protein FACS1894108_05880 [Planctomycetales bacterium]GHT05302.1 hypothetical protein FACS1894139_08870 [Planctomycetales bacterium]